MQVPSEDDWRSEPWGTDTPYAYTHFYGLTIAEAAELFEDNALRYLEDVMFMPHCVFRYLHQSLHRVPDVRSFKR